MKISKVEIANYRSIKHLEFEPGAHNVLIGENNAGKSNILRAIGIVLGESWPSERMFSEEDFHNQDTSEPISIKVFFDEVISTFRNNMPVNIAGFQVICKAYKRRVKNKPAGSLAVEYTCINKNGDTLKQPAAPLKKGQRYTGQWLNIRVSNDLRDQIPFIYVDILREYDKHTPSSRWSILRRLFNEVNKEFSNDKKQINVTLPDGSSVKMTRKEAFASIVKEAYKYLRTPSFKEIEQKLAANALEHMGLDAEQSDVQLHFESHDPTNAFKSLQLYVNQLGIQSPASEVGSGLQSAIVVAIFRTYEELKKEGAIFAIEEPEVFLHPQKARYFQSVLNSLSQKGNQVFLTTHSPVFVQISEPETVVVVRRDEDQGTWALKPKKAELAPGDRHMLRLLTEFDTQRNELFFARKVMLVEGNTEKVVMPLVFKALEVDINRFGISVIECGGKTKLPLFIRVVQALGIPYVVLADHDIRDIDESWSEKRQIKERERNKNHIRWNKELEELTDAGRLFFLKPDLEGVSGLPKAEDQKIDRALELFSTVNRDDVPNQILSPVKFLLKHT